MSQPPEPHPPGPPHNPGVRDLVAGKRRWSSPPNREHAKQGFRGWHERGYLPHRDEPGLTQFVTFRLADSLPAELRGEWEAFLAIEDQRERRKQLEAYLDRGRGECLLRRPDIGALMDGALRFNHGKYYKLRAWVVMPNHVHVLFKVGSKSMGRMVGEWKEYTARLANKILGRRGQFWDEDYWDTYMRDRAHEARSRRYIENNPTKAFLVRDPAEWPWTSARHRNQHGELLL
jgi:REP element-mobilizing transposase RayT